MPSPLMRAKRTLRQGKQEVFTAKDVKVGVKDRLSGGLAFVGDHAESAFRDTGDACDFDNGALDLRKQRRVERIDVQDGLEMGFWYDEDVDGRHFMDVLKRDDPF